MITKKGGRAYHTRTNEEDEAALLKALDGLDPSEASLVLQILQEQQQGVNGTFQALNEYLYERQPVTIQEFIENDYYMGKACKTLYPKLKEHILNIYEKDRYNTVIATGSTGLGKTFIGTLILCYEIYLLSCLRSPQATYGLSDATEMHIVLISKNLHLAQSVLMSALLEKLKSSPYFLLDFPFDERQGSIRFPKSITVEIGSVHAERVLGLTIISACMDETDFLGQSKNKPQIAGQVGQKLNIANYDAAEKLYVKLSARIKSRFINTPGKFILLSSKTTTASFTERRLAESKDDPGVYVIDHATWEVKPQSQYCGKKFRILVGNHTVRSRILAENEEISPEFLESTGAILYEVPIEFKPEFEKNLYEAIRDTAGLSTDAISQFISKQSSLYDAIQKEKKHPFSHPTWTLGLPFQVFWQELCEQRVVRLDTGHKEVRWFPKLHPGALRVIHIDTSIAGDRTGISMGHIVRWVEVERYAPDTAETYIEHAPEIEIDFCLQVAPQIGEYIMLDQVRGLIYSMIDHGFSVARVTTDQYQSVDTLQQLRTRGINADLLSVDRDPVAYEALRAALAEGRLKMYEYPQFIAEAIKLERDPLTGKIDHPLGGEKDVSDSLAGVVASLEHLALSMSGEMIVDVGVTEKIDPDAWIRSPLKPQQPQEPLKRVESQLKKAQLADASGRKKVGKGDGNGDEYIPPFLT